MAIDVTVKIGGEAGQGIQTVGQLLAQTCHNAGLYIMAINDFESRIRGGHSFFQIRIGDHPVYAPNHKVNLLIALNSQTLELHQKEIVTDGLVIMDAKKAGFSNNILRLPISELAERAGGIITANTVAAGACLALLGAPLELFQKVVSKQFSKKGAHASDQNMKAAQSGYKAVEGVAFKHSFCWENNKIPKGMLIDGAQSFAMGALAGDCRFAAFYPMSPATSIMANLSSLTDTFPLVVEQVEDEIAAANMIVGASYAGIRAITATSGGGFCLMTEALGLAGITETPMVIIDAQRPGPATGLPTRTAQGDLHFAIRASQDEFPRFVFAPGSPEQAYETTSRALHLSEKYQVPAVILSDQYLNDSLYITEDEFSVPESIERFIEEGKDGAGTANYKRYAVTDSGISPRRLPCRGNALVIASGNEHREDGHITEEITDRNKMVQKRNKKIQAMLSEIRPPNALYENAKIMLVGWGSTKGAITEAVGFLREEGIDAGSLHFVDIWPFPADAVFNVLSSSTFFVVEQNSSGQMAQLIRQETGLKSAANVLKYDGRPLYPVEIVKKLKEYLQ